jgi:anti-sigma factor RsiW
MNRDEAARLMHAYVDGEISAAESRELEAHMAENPAARAAYDRLRELSAAIRGHAEYHAAPASLASDLLSLLPEVPEEAPRRPRWQLWLAQAAAMTGVAVVTWAATMGYLRPGEDDRLATEILASHVRATLGKRLYDVASSDQHTVKPWLSARLAYSPPVADLSAQGFELLGARLDHVGGQPVAVLVYKRRQHIVEAYVWPARGRTATLALKRDGFNIERFAAGEMDFWLVSDLNRNELGDFARLLAQNGAAP